MITIKRTWVKVGNRGECPVMKEKFEKALEVFVEADLMWGGQITEVAETSITVVTEVMGCTDTTVFSGPKKEMQPLLDVAYYYLKGTAHNLAVDGAVKAASMMLGKKAGNPLLLSFFAPLLIGGSRVKIATMLGCGITAQDEIEMGLKLSIKDLVAAVQMKYEGLVGSFKEAFALAG